MPGYRYQHFFYIFIFLYFSDRLFSCNFQTCVLLVFITVLDFATVLYTGKKHGENRILLRGFKKAGNQARASQVLGQDHSNLRHFPPILVIPISLKKKYSSQDFVFMVSLLCYQFPNSVITNIQLALLCIGVHVRSSVQYYSCNFKRDEVQMVQPSPR